MRTLHEIMGLPTAAEVEAAQARMRGAFAGARKASQRARTWQEQLAERTGLPVAPTLWGESDADADEFEDASEGEPEEDDDGSWWPWVIGAGFVGYIVYNKLKEAEVSFSEDIGFDIPGFEIDHIPWTEERVRQPGPPQAARVADPMLHGGLAVPGPGSPDVLISGSAALTTRDVVGACPMPHLSGLPHMPIPGSWMTTNANDVLVNGVPLLRAGDWIDEHLGGPNPIIAGAPTVLAGPPARPCVVQEQRNRAMSEFVPGLERVGFLGGRVDLTGTVKWSALDMLGGAAAIGLAYAGPAGAWGSRLLLGVIDGPTLQLDTKVTGTFFADFRFDLDLDRDGVIDMILRLRRTRDFSIENTQSVVTEGKRPGIPKPDTLKEGDLEFETSSDTQVQVHRADEQREPWKGEE